MSFPISSNQHAHRQLFQRLGLWYGVSAVGYLMLIATTVPQFALAALGGVGLGGFFLWSLAHSVQRPLGGWQIVFSLMRMVLLAYLIVMLGHARFDQTLIVLGGFLSFKTGFLVQWLWYCGSELARFRRKTP